MKRVTFLFFVSIFISVPLFSFAEVAIKNVVTLTEKDGNKFAKAFGFNDEDDEDKRLELKLSEVYIYVERKNTRISASIEIGLLPMDKEIVIEGSNIIRYISDVADAKVLYDNMSRIKAVQKPFQGKEKRLSKTLSISPLLINCMKSLDWGDSVSCQIELSM